MKIRILVFLLTCIFVRISTLPKCFSQTGSEKKYPVRMEWSGEENGSARFWYAKVIGQNEDGIFLLKSNMSLESNEEKQGFRTRKYALAFYSNEMTFKWEKTISPGVKNSEIEKIVFFNEKVLMIYSVYMKINEAEQIWVQTMDSHGVNTEVPHQLFEIPNLKKNSDFSIDAVFSSNHSLLGINVKFVKNETPADTIKGASVLASVWDEQFSPLLKKELLLPITDSEFQPDNFFVSNDSLIFYTALSSDKTQGGFLIYSYDLKSGQTNFSHVDADTKKITEYIFAIDNRNKKLVLSGFYSDQNTYSAAGTFFTNIHFNGLTAEPMNIHAFDESFLNNFIGEPKTGDKKELLNFRINKMVLKNNGGALLLAESSYLTEYTYYDFFTKTYITRTVYHFDNIMALSIAPDGTPEWNKLISKKQESQEDDGYYSSYFPVVYGDNVYFLYNSFLDKLTSTHLNSFNGKGEETHYVLTEAPENVAFIPRASRQVDANISIVPAFRKNKFYLIRVTF